MRAGIATVIAGTLAAAAARADAPLGLWPLRVQEHRPGGSVGAIAQTRDGLIWTAGDGGLQRFDGRRFVRAPGIDEWPPVNVVGTDAAGNLWFARPGEGVSRLERSRAPTVVRNGLPRSVVIALEKAEDGALWAIGRREVARLVPGSEPPVFEPVDLPGGPNVDNWLRGRDGTLWLDTDAGFIRLGPGKCALTPWSTTSAREKARFLADVLLDGRGREALARVTTPPVPSDLKTMFEDGTGRVWLGTVAGVVLVAADGLVVTVTARDGLPDDLAARFFEDQEGNVWTVTHGGGLALMSISPLARLAAREGLRGNTPFGVAVAGDGTVWATTTHGLTSIRDGKPTFIGDGGYGQLRGVSVGADGSIWLATLGPRVVRFEPALGRWTASDLQGLLPGAIPRALAAHGDGVLVAPSDGSLWQLDPNAPARQLRAPVHACAHLTRPGEGRCPAQIAAIAPRRDGGLWLATVDEGVHVMTDAWSEEVAAKARVGVWSLHEDATGTLWIAGDKGLYRRHGDAVEPEPRVQAEPTFAALTDGTGALWYGGLRGVVRLPPGRAGEPARFTTQDGLPSDQLMPGWGSTSARDAHGGVWFTTVTGLASTMPGQVRAEATAPAPYFDEIEANGQRFVHPLAPAPLDVPPGRGEIAIAYGAPAFASPHRVRFSYRLEGYDDRFGAATDRTIAHYANLRPGSYVFRVRAFAADRPEAAREATLALRIRPYFHQRPVFYALLAGFGVLLVGLAIVLRGRALQARFALVLEERHRIARDLHDTLAQVFAGLKLQVDNVLSADPSERGRELARLEQLRRMISKGRRTLRAVVWNLRTDTGAPGSVVRGLEELTGIYDGARVCLRTSGTPYALPMPVETELLHVAQQAVSNAIEHGGAREIGIDVEFGERTFEIWIRDDGRGFEADAAGERPAHGHFGIMGMRERARRAGGELVIESAPDVGSEVGVVIPTSKMRKAQRP